MKIVGDPKWDDELEQVFIRGRYALLPGWVSVMLLILFRARLAGGTCSSQPSVVGIAKLGMLFAILLCTTCCTVFVLAVSGGSDLGRVDSACLGWYFEVCGDRCSFLVFFCLVVCVKYM